MGTDIQNVPYAHSKGQGIPIEVVRLTELRTREMGIDITAPTRHDFYVLMFVTGGAGAHWVDFTRHALRKGDVLQVRPDQVHAFDARSSHEALLLVFRPEMVPETQVARLAVHLSRPVRLEPPAFAFLVQVLELMLRMEQVPERLRLPSMASGLLQVVLAGLDDLYSRQGGVPSAPAHPGVLELVHRFEQLLHQRGGRLLLADYAEQLHTTPRTLSRACHQVRGISPKKLIDQCLALEAKRKLILGDHAVEEIAFDLGFSEATNFVKFFKRIAGQTPEAFRDGQRRQRKRVRF